MGFRAYNSKGVDKNRAKCNMGFRAYNSKGVDKKTQNVIWGSGVLLKSTKKGKKAKQSVKKQ